MRSDSAEIAKYRLEWILAMDRGKYVEGKIQTIADGYTRFILDKPITVLSDEMLEYEYNPITGIGCARTWRVRDDN